MIAPPTFPAAASALSGLVLLLMIVILNTTWINVTDDQKTKVQSALKYVGGVFALATAANLFYQFSPDPTKRTIIQSATASV